MRSRPRAFSRGQVAVHCPVVLQPAPLPAYSPWHLLLAFFLGAFFTVIFFDYSDVESVLSFGFQLFNVRTSA